MKENTVSTNKGLKPLVDKSVNTFPLQLWFVNFATHNTRVSERMKVFGILGGDPVLFSSEDQVFIAEKIFELCRKNNIPVLALNVLPDHVHMMMAAATESDLSEKVRKIKGYSSFAFQRSHQWPKKNGHVWSQKFSREQIKNMEAAKTIIEYILQNHEKHQERWGKELASTWNKGLKPLVERHCVPLSVALKWETGFD